MVLLSRGMHSNDEIFTKASIILIIIRTKGRDRGGGRIRAKDNHLFSQKRSCYFNMKRESKKNNDFQHAIIYRRRPFFKLKTIFWH